MQTILVGRPDGIMKRVNFVPGKAVAEYFQEIGKGEYSEGKILVNGVVKDAIHIVEAGTVTILSDKPKTGN